MPTISDTKNRILKVINDRLDKSLLLTCPDILALAQVTSELEKNDIFKVMSANVGNSAFGSEEED